MTWLAFNPGASRRRTLDTYFGGRAPSPPHRAPRTFGRIWKHRSRATAVTDGFVDARLTEAQANACTLKKRQPF